MAIAYPCAVVPIVASVNAMPADEEMTGRTAVPLVRHNTTSRSSVAGVKDPVVYDSTFVVTLIRTAVVRVAIYGSGTPAGTGHPPGGSTVLLM